MNKKTTEFQEKVYACLKNNVPAGKVTTYGTLAKFLQSSPRAIGQAMRCNPYAPQVPCHRVVSSDGSIGGFNGERKGEAIERKVALLKKEGVPVIDGKIENKYFLKI
jgi:methylated-DNA-[protein]-cysteine S-methyltransferase